MDTRTPSVGRIVHYVGYGTPGGEYGKECRAAIVTDVSPDGTSLAVLNPTGMFFKERLSFHDGSGDPGHPDCPVAAHHGSPHRYCTCGWSEPTLRGGTWHWPEQV